MRESQAHVTTSGLLDAAVRPTSNHEANADQTHHRSLDHVKREPPLRAEVAQRFICGL